MTEDSMEVEPPPPADESIEIQEQDINLRNDVPNEIMDYLIANKDTFFKHQQMGDAELPETEKRKIASNIFSKSKANFLCRFGKCLKETHLEYFKTYTTDEQEGYAIGYYLADLKRYYTENKRIKDVKNRRYDALKKLTDQSSYFSETEMMKRNPLLYDQLVGQYLSEDERKKRDNIDTQNITLVNLLLESIDRETIRKKQKQQLDDEAEVIEVDTSESEDEKQEKLVKAIRDVNMSDEEEIPTTSRWGEFENPEDTPEPPTRRFDFIPNFFQEPDSKSKPMNTITATERKLLKEEFTSIMYQNFLDGKDADFDYSTVDNNDDYDNLEIKTHDAEDSYFDSESPEDVPLADAKMAEENETSEDELDIFMNRLSQHPSVRQLS